MTTSDALTRERAPQARLDRKKNRVLMLVSLATAAGGLALFTLALLGDWGFLAGFWSAVLALIGVGWVVGLLKGGGAASAGCPHCGEPMAFMHIQTARTEQCARCGRWSAGRETMRPLAPDHVASVAVFSVALPEHEPRWPAASNGTPRCPVCAKPSTRSVTVAASSVAGGAFAALSPISLQRVHRLRVPACSQHDDGIVLDMDSDDHGLVLLFRSWAYFHDFVALHRSAPPAPPAMAPAAQTLAEFLEHHPRPLEVRAPLICPKHEVPVLTAMGWVSIMDLLPSHEWMDDSAQNPVCLELGHHVERPKQGKYEHARVAWCPECELGMAAARAAR